MGGGDVHITEMRVFLLTFHNSTPHAYLLSKKHMEIL